MNKLRKSKKLILIILIFFAIISPIFKTDKWNTIYSYNKICYQNDCFHYEIADTPETRQLWLMYRESLPIQSWMLFFFNESSIHSFRMKNTLIPLDILRLDKNFEIIYISPNTPPCTELDCPWYGPQAKSKYVLEVNAGLSKERSVWDRMILR